MAHHQHHGADYDAQVSRSLQTRPTSACATSMPIISEDDALGDADEPPDSHQYNFVKTPCSSHGRKQSLLTRALTTDSESHDEDPMCQAYFGHLPSVSSTCSNYSNRSVGDFTSDDGRISPSTRASTPGSPHSMAHVPKFALNSLKHTSQPPPDEQHESDSYRKSSTDATSAGVEPNIEAKLGRKRCITFACGRKDTTTTKPETQKAVEEKEKEKPQKRPCAIKFACPFTGSKSAKNDDLQRANRKPSPAPQAMKTVSPSVYQRKHRDSDTTIKNESPKNAPPTSTRARRFSNLSDCGKTEAGRFHEFAASDEEVDEWTQEPAPIDHKITVNDTLKKENDIRKLVEEADEEEAMDKELKDDESISDIELGNNSSDDDDLTDDGFQTDDEDGFAESDEDEEDDDSDYEWWTPRKSRNPSPFVATSINRPRMHREASDSSIQSSDELPSPGADGKRRHKKRTRPMPIRPGTPELPDSTDFVCGTLDEDRPLEQAYMSCMAQKRAAKHKTIPQDIDPSFPTSDPEIENDDNDEDEAFEHRFMHGHPDNFRDEENRGRKPGPAPRGSPHPSPKRFKSPAPAKKRVGRLSPAPKKLFSHSPHRRPSPMPAHKIQSPPPSRRGSTAGEAVSFGVPFLGQRTQEVTHTSSLPRSPHPFARRRGSTTVPPASRVSLKDDEEDDEITETEKPYTRGAMDIAQGLECKRLKRREKFYKQYCKKEEKKKARRPQPGKGAERMKQVGLECAVLRGARMLSI